MGNRLARSILHKRMNSLGAEYPSPKKVNLSTMGRLYKPQKVRKFTYSATKIQQESQPFPGDAQLPPVNIAVKLRSKIGKLLARIPYDSFDPSKTDASGTDFR